MTGQTTKTTVRGAGPVHKLSAEAKVQLFGVGQERLYKTSREEYYARVKEIYADEYAACRKQCCKGRKG